MGECKAPDQVESKPSDTRDPTLPPPCGSASMYERYGCRGEACKINHNLKMKAYRERRRGRG